MTLYADDLVVIAARWPCGVCGSNSIQYTSCLKWIHRKCSGINSSMSWCGHVLQKEDNGWVKKCMKWMFPDQEVDQRGLGERLCKRLSGI